MRPALGATLLGALICFIGCGRDDSEAQHQANTTTRTSPRGAATGSTSAQQTTPSTWVDPEPPSAQALAEQVLAAPFNTDKVTRLQMSITTIVGHTTGITGFGSSLASQDTSLDKRLQRLGATVTDHDVTIRLPGSILFDFDKAGIRPDAERTLTEVLEVLKAYSQRSVRIEGHTDSIASDAYNRELSERRAAAVRDWLVKHGLGGSRLRPMGHGESQPVAENTTPEGRQKNRRVEIVIETKG
ncbi:MAG: OmpA family protein [Acidobacteriota bacterium]